MNHTCDPLEPRQLLSAPVLTNAYAESGLRDYIAIDAPATLHAHAATATGTRAVTFFLDRNGNGLWDKGTDLDFGADVRSNPPTDAEFTVPITPTADWGFDPFQRIFASGVSASGEWSTPVQIGFFATYPRPFIESASTTVRSQQTETGFLYTATVTASAFTPNSGRNAYIGGITFFVDRNLDNSWTPGIDIDIGAARVADSRGFYTISYSAGSVRPGRICAVAFSSVLYPSSSGAFGPVAIAAEFDGQGGVESASAANLSGRLGVVSDRTGDPIRLSTIVSSTDSSYTLGAVTLFHDANADGVWTPGVDTDVGVFNFQASFPVYRARGQIEFTLQPQFGTGLQHFVLAVRSDAVGYASKWSPTSTFVMNIVGQPSVNNITLAQSSFSATGSVIADFDVHDDFAVRDVAAFLDRNGNGVYDQGEGIAQNGNYVRLTPGLKDGRWRVSISLAGLGYAPGTYQLRITAFDFNDVPSLVAASVPVTLV